MIDLRFRPYDAWPHQNTPRRINGPFKIAYLNALKHLETELKHVGAKQIVIATGHRKDEIRQDGWPRSTAKDPTHPGVIVFFDSKHGPLSFDCDTYRDWRDNLRAIGLTLENLRAVERYGATKRGEQYKGFAALPAPDAQAPEPRRAAALVLLKAAGCNLTEENVEYVLSVPSACKSAYNQAVRQTHPDHGGTTEAFQSVRDAYALLQQ
jgi:hypothetical protein